VEPGRNWTILLIHTPVTSARLRADSFTKYPQDHHDEGDAYIYALISPSWGSSFVWSAEDGRINNTKEGNEYTL
jgi:hypothetical protein